jgi:hypothetical protein
VDRLGRLDGLDLLGLLDGLDLLGLLDRLLEWLGRPTGQ